MLRVKTMSKTDWIITFFESKIGPGKEFATRVDMARFLGLSQTQQTKLFNFLKGSDTQYKAVLDWFERLGGKFEADAPPSKDVCFIDARVAPAGERLLPPPNEDYLAVPLVEEVGAGPGIIPQHELISWFLVWRHQRAIQHKRDLIAVMLGKHSTSMIPTLKPQDIVLVDRQDKDVMNFKGRIMLVLDPADGSGKIKRVAAENLPKKRDYRITYYSDNAADNPPEVYSLMEDFEGDWNKSIVGRVVWAWSDVSGK